MSKYEEFQHLFVEDGDAHLNQSDACFDAIDDLTYQLIDYSGWYTDDVEYISLGQPILPGKPQQIMRIKRSGRNRDRIRELATWVNNGWSLGIRFRLRPHLSVSFQPREVMFVLPILVRNQGNEAITIQIESEGTCYLPGEFDRLVELTFQRVQTILEQGVQQLIGKSHRPEELHDLGFVLDSENLEELGIETGSKRPIQPAQPVQADDHPPEVETVTGKDSVPAAMAVSVVKEKVQAVPTQVSDTPPGKGTARKSGRSRKSN